MTTFSIGREAEAAAAEYLLGQGYKILQQNWRTRFCEIDIVAQKDKVVYFVEVKYRQSESFGSGLEYITPKKLKQMRFAAEVWVSEHAWNDDYSLAAIEVTAPTFKITSFLSEV